MRIITLSIIFACASIFSFGANSQFNTDSNSTVAFPAQSGGLPNSNFIAINERNATLHFTKVVALYNDFAAKSLKKGSSKTAEHMLLKRSIPLSLRYGTNESDYDCFMALANIYVGQKKYSQAKWYFIQSNESAKKGNYSKGEILSLMRLAYVKRLIGDNTLALQDLKLAEKIAAKTKHKTYLTQIRKTIKAYSKKSASKSLASVKKAQPAGGR